MEALDYLHDLVPMNTTSSRTNLPAADYVEEALKRLDFKTERIEYDDANGVRKASIVGKRGEGQGGMAYFGHTDTVPADTWFTDDHGPFEPTIKGDRLYGRGSCDMKGSISCMLAAAGRFAGARFRQPLYITLTSDEEIGYGGAAAVARESRYFREMIAGGTRGIIGEPTMGEVVYAHKGTYGFIATSHGKAAHSSSREGLNANLAMIPFLSEMKRIHDETEEAPEWQNDEFDPPGISWNIGINDHTRVVNMKAAQSICTVYFRPMAGMDADGLMQAGARKGRGVRNRVQPPVDGQAHLHGSRLGLRPRSTGSGAKTTSPDGCLRHRRRHADGVGAVGGDGPRRHRSSPYPRRVDLFGPDREGHPTLCADDPPMVRRRRLRRTDSGGHFYDEHQNHDQHQD